MGDGGWTATPLFKWRPNKWGKDQGAQVVGQQIKRAVVCPSW